MGSEDSEIETEEAVGASPRDDAPATLCLQLIREGHSA